MPQMLREIVNAALSQQPDIEIVGQAGDVDGLLAKLRVRAADLVVLDCPEQQVEAIGGRLARAHDSLKLLALSGSAGRGYLFELLPRTECLGELSPGDLAPAIRAACARPAAGASRATRIAAGERPTD